MKELLKEIFSEKDLIDSPPVLVDIGASGWIVKEWAEIAKYSICIVFEPDEREFSYIENEKSIYKKLIVFNCVTTNTSNSTIDFYLTKFPYCSSILEPDLQKLNDWSFFDLFTVNKKITMTSRNLKEILKELTITKIDWFKTDSQGIDLRLFTCLGEDVYNKTIIAEFEPGLIDAYKGEDKLFSLISFMENNPFWISDIKLLGSRRIHKNIIQKYNIAENVDRLITSPGWAEISFINTFKQNLIQTHRDYLLGWVFSTIKHHHGFALEIADAGFIKFGMPIYKKMIDYSVNEFNKKLPKPDIRIRIIDRLKRLFIKLKLFPEINNNKE